MHFLTTDSVLLGVGLLLQGVLCIVLFRKSLVGDYPVFTTYLVLSILEDAVSATLNPYTPGYQRYYFVTSVLDYILQLLIIVEIGRNVLQPVRRSPLRPLRQIAGIGLLLAIIIALSFYIPSHVLNGDMIQLSLKAALVLAVLKLLLFACLAGFAQMLGIGWKNHVLQLATGLAFFACASLFVQMASSHLSAAMPDYMERLDGLMHIQSAAFGATLVFWIWAFSRNEAPRKDFTPQMQEVLVTIAETARRTRLAVTRSTDRR
jgi:ABC-type transport system involved in multi-copper enzyme maturation permease subunit